MVNKQSYASEMLVPGIGIKVERGERHEFWLNPIAPLRPSQESPAAKEYRLQLRAQLG